MAFWKIASKWIILKQKYWENNKLLWYDWWSLEKVGLPVGFQNLSWVYVENYLKTEEVWTGGSIMFLRPSLNSWLYSN